MNVKFSLLKLNKNLVFQCHEISQSENKVVIVDGLFYLIRIGGSTSIDLEQRKITLSHSDNVWIKRYTNNESRDISYDSIIKILKTWGDAC